MILFLDGLAVFLVLVLALVGFQRGFIEELGRLIGLVAATLVALRYYLPFGQMIINRSSQDPRFTLVLSFGILFIVVLVTVRLLTRMIRIMLLARHTRVADRSLGLIFGAGKGGVILALAVWLVALAPDNSWTQIIRSQSRLYQPLASGRLAVIRLFRLDDALEKGQNLINQWLAAEVVDRDQQLLNTTEEME
ncbi:MAG: CvpA family protein [Candidatus Neomarinimicrobiota bacterium]